MPSDVSARQRRRGGTSDGVLVVSAEAVDWLARRTFHHARFADVGALVAAKGSRTVSVVLPARDEARTVGSIVECLRRELVERHPLIDELVVCDSGSRDGTADVARDAGARVVAQSDVLAAHGDVPGKGEAMWKSLAATTGDLIAWVDADVDPFDVSFVLGLLGPLLVDDSIGYVKGCYERPLAERDRLRPTGGGRVTELVARPWLDMFWPALAGFVQPLAGEQAGRRALLERLPFVSGYGVETGLLLDHYREHGLDALAQVDLERRVHRNQSTRELGRMAFQIQQTLLTRLQREGRMTLAEDPVTTLVQFRVRGPAYAMDPQELPVTERPPLVDVPEYVAARAAGRACA